MSIPTITPDKLNELKQSEPSLELIDVRTPAEYRELHVQFAENIPLDQLNPASVMEARNGNADQPLYIICRSGSRGENACQQFQQAGFTNVINVEGGTLACQQTSLPLEHGKKSISLERQVRIAAGSIVLLGAILGWQIHEGFYGISAFVGAGLVFAGITDTCAMGMMIAKMPWNK